MSLGITGYRTVVRQLVFVNGAEYNAFAKQLDLDNEILARCVDIREGESPRFGYTLHDIYMDDYAATVTVEFSIYTFEGLDNIMPQSPPEGRLTSDM